MTYDFGRVDGIVFDFGGVMSVSPMAGWERTFYPYCESLGVPRQAVKDGFVKYRRQWDGDAISFAELYARIFADAGVPAPTPKQLAEIRRLDAASWAETRRPETLALMRELKAQGKKLGILSNMSSDFHAEFFAPRFAEYRALADVEVISGFEHMCKPDRCIYDLTAERMGIAPARLMFLDDTRANVEAARGYGWQSEVYVSSITSPETTICCGWRNMEAQVI